MDVLAVFKNKINCLQIGLKKFCTIKMKFKIGHGSLFLYCLCLTGLKAI
jgi:hypothetical protein